MADHRAGTGAANRRPGRSPRAVAPVARVVPVRARAPAGRHSGASVAKGAHVSGKRSALDTLSAAEKATVLDEVVAARPERRDPAEAYAIQVLTGAVWHAVAAGGEGARLARDLVGLGSMSGCRR